MTGGFADKQPARLETSADTVRFRTGSVAIPTTVALDWDGGSVVAVGVCSHAEPDGLGVLITLDDAGKMRHALGEILDRARREGA